MRDRYSVAVGLIFLAVIVVAAIHTVGGGGAGGTLGLDRQPPRWPLPEFAVPVAAGQLEGDANVAQDDCGSAAVPCPEEPPRTPACRIAAAEAIRVCDLFGRPLVISFWFTKGGNCADQQDVVNRVYERYRGRVNFLSLDVRDDRDTVRELVRLHGWRLPVGYDRDGAVASLYKVGGCPTFAYAYPGGTLRERQHRRPHRRPAERPGRAPARRHPGGGTAAMSAGAAEPRMGWDPAPEQGWVAPHIAAEFPGLGIAWVEVDAMPGRSPEPVRRRLRDLSDRFYGAQAIHMRERPIPWAYRVFFRQIGLDPDRTRTPVERLAFERIREGAFKSRGVPADALTVSIVETGVALRAFDADSLSGGLCIRDSAPGEALPGRPGELAQGTLAIADDRGPVGLLFGATGDGYGVEPASRRLAIVAVQVKGVPQIAVDEALWMAAATVAA